MQEIKCTKCGEVFLVDESGYAAILKQVRDKEFDKEIRDRAIQFKTEKENEIKLVMMEAKKELDTVVAEKNAMIAELHAKIEAEGNAKKLAITEAISTKDKEIAELHAKIDAEDNAKKLAIIEAISTKNKEIADKDGEIAKLVAQLGVCEKDKQLAVSEAVSAKDKEIAEKKEHIFNLKGKLDLGEIERQLKENSLRDDYEIKLRSKDEQLECYKNFKARLSTKMVGESLEQHCEIEFNKVRATGFQNAYFEKDTDIKTGSKGDYIYKEIDSNGTEFISIMFEMKNEMDETATKKKNEDFLKELDKDRKEKNCEYAILVSLLDQENELYSSGIVDMSHRYPKMYVIRPQFFIPMITLLRNAAMNSLRYRQELEVIKNQNVDISNFEENMNDFKQKFSKNFQLASTKFVKAIEDIDKTIGLLQKTKEELTSSQNNLRLANNKADDLSIKRLTNNSPTMAAKFSALAKEREGGN